MTEEKEIPYPKTAMLPNVDYKELGDDIFDSELVHLEAQTMRNLSDFTEKFKEILLKEKMIQLPEIMTAHLCAYLGFFTVAGLGIKQAIELYPNITKLLEKQAHYSYEQFLKYPVNSDEPNQETKKKNLATVRALAPSSIVVQTIRLGRIVHDAMEGLYNNRDISFICNRKKQTELFCPQDMFIKLLKQTIPKTIKEWKQGSIFRSLLYPLYAINQATIQLGWLMGYFAHLDKTPPTTYLEYGLPVIQLYVEYGDKFLACNRLKQPVRRR